MSAVASSQSIDIMAKVFSAQLGMLYAFKYRHKPLKLKREDLLREICMRVNCWEAKKCGCQPGSNRSSGLGICGICPASKETNAHGINGGTNGGRACWAIEHTLCGNSVQGSYRQKLNGCMQCDFYASVMIEEKENYMSTKEILAVVKGQHEFTRKVVIDSGINCQNACG